mgnify:CR=1 FL=1
MRNERLPRGRRGPASRMRQLTCVEAGKLEWRDVPEPRLEGRPRGADPPAGGRALRHRPLPRRRLVPAARRRSRSATSASARSSRSATRCAGSRSASAWCPRSRSAAGGARMPRRADRDLRAAAACSPTTACSRSRASSTAACSPTWCACRTPRRCCSRSRRASDPVALGERLRQRARRLPRRRAAPARAARRATCWSSSHGTPSIPLYAAQAAVALGAGRVDFASDDRESLALAEKLGAHRSRRTSEARRGRYPIVVGRRAHARRHLATPSAPPSPRASARASASTPARETPLPLGRMYTLGIRFFVGRCHAAALLPEVVPLIEAGGSARRRDHARGRLGRRRRRLARARRSSS